MFDILGVWEKWISFHFEMVIKCAYEIISTYEIVNEIHINFSYKFWLIQILNLFSFICLDYVGIQIFMSQMKVAISKWNDINFAETLCIKYDGFYLYIGN